MNNKNNALYSTFCQYISYHNKALSRVSKSQSITQDGDIISPTTHVFNARVYLCTRVGD